LLDFTSTGTFSGALSAACFCALAGRNPGGFDEK
jgi:hypothetical protein